MTGWGRMDGYTDGEDEAMARWLDGDGPRAHEGDDDCWCGGTCTPRDIPTDSDFLEEDIPT